MTDRLTEHLINQRVRELFFNRPEKQWTRKKGYDAIEQTLDITRGYAKQLVRRVADRIGVDRTKSNWMERWWHQERHGKTKPIFEGYDQ